QHHVVGQTRAQPLCHGVVHGARTLTASYHQDYRSACCREPPAHARIRATWPGHGRRVNGVAGLAYPRPGVRVEADCRLAVTEVDLAGMAAEPSRGEAGHAVLLLERDRHAVRHRVGQPGARSIAAGAQHQRGSRRLHLPPQHAPRAGEPQRGLPVLPGPRTIERMQIEQQVRELRCRQDITLDTAPGANENRPNARVGSDQCPGNRESWIEVSARAAASEPDDHGVEAVSGLVARSPTTRSRVLPILTRMPVMRIESTRFVRPYEMNGKVRPVVGSKPITTPMCRNAVLTVVNVMPIAVNC